MEYHAYYNIPNLVKPLCKTMANMNNELESPDISSVEEEGKKVSGGSESGGSEASAENETTGGPETGGEKSPDEELKKEEMTGYNEHPDQEKVGGG